MTEPRALAIVREYDDLIAAVRARMAELEMTFDILDHRSGVQVGYSAKILGPTPTKRFGPVSLGCVLGALRMKMILVEDPNAMRNYRLRMEKRRMAKPMLPAVACPNCLTPERSRKLNDARMQKVSPERRKRSASIAARARWGRTVR